MQTIIQQLSAHTKKGTVLFRELKCVESTVIPKHAKYTSYCDESIPIGTKLFY